jgi:hypothetical protein
MLRRSRTNENAHVGTGNPSHWAGVMAAGPDVFARRFFEILQPSMGISAGLALAENKKAPSFANGAVFGVNCCEAVGLAAAWAATPSKGEPSAKARIGSRRVH